MNAGVASPKLTILAATRIEASTMRLGVRRPPIRRLGHGSTKSAVGAALAKQVPDSAVALLGLARSVAPSIRHGDVVVASEVRGPGDEPPVAVPSAPLVATVLRHAGFTVHVGPLLSASEPVDKPSRNAEIAPDADTEGVIAVDLESAAAVRQLVASGRPFAVVRSISDVDTQPLMSWPTLVGRAKAMRTLHQVVPAIVRWAATCANRDIVLAGPRSFCAGVERAIGTVEAAIAKFGAPVYVRRQIVHNTHVVRDLEAAGAMFVHELDEVPDGATVVLAAHGVSPAVRAEAEHRDLHVIDATCPLVAKVHHEAQRYADRGYQVVLVGDDDHEEVQGTVGHAPDAITVVSDIAAVTELDIGDPNRVAWISQTTLATDETAAVVDALQTRFPAIAGPRANDICYATQNRQDAVRAIASGSDVVLVVGSRNSSNSNRLVEVARRNGAPAHLLEDATELDPAWLAGASTIGVTAGASAPAAAVEQVVAAIESLGTVEISEQRVVDEDVQFPLPSAVR